VLIEVLVNVNSSGILPTLTISAVTRRVISSDSMEERPGGRRGFPFSQGLSNEIFNPLIFMVEIY
jgi:hypothetical protein